MGYQANYAARHFTRGAKAIAYERQKDKAGIARCKECTAALAPGHIHYDHIVPWAISKHSGPRNCQALCDACHGKKTAERDIPAIAQSNSVRDAFIGAMPASRHPLPFGRKSRLRKPLRGGPPVARVSQIERSRAYLATLPPRRGQPPTEAPAFDYAGHADLEREHGPITACARAQDQGPADRPRPAAARRRQSPEHLT